MSHGRNLQWTSRLTSRRGSAYTPPNRGARRLGVFSVTITHTLPCLPAGVAVLVSPEIPLQLGVDSRQQFCLQSLPSMERLPLQYTVCVAQNVKAAHQEAMQQLSQDSRELPNMKTLWSVQFGPIRTCFVFVFVFFPHSVENSGDSDN